MLPLESIEPPLFEVDGDRTVSRDAFDLPPSNSPIHESPTVARSEPRTTIGSARSAWNIHAHFVGRQREDGLDTLPARAAEANRSTLIADIPFPAPENVAAKRCASEKRAF